MLRQQNLNLNLKNLRVEAKAEARAEPNVATLDLIGPNLEILRRKLKRHNKARLQTVLDRPVDRPVDRAVVDKAATPAVRRTNHRKTAAQV